MDEEPDANAHLTHEQRELVKRALTGYGEQGANGYDLSMFKEDEINLKTAFMHLTKGITS